MASKNQETGNISIIKLNTIYQFNTYPGHQLNKDEFLICHAVTFLMLYCWSLVELWPNAFVTNDRISKYERRHKGKRYWKL